MSKRNRRDKYNEDRGTVEHYDDYDEGSLDLEVKSRRNLIPRTKNQKEYIRTMAENDITICTGPAGSGKTFVSTGLAVQYLERRLVDRLMFSRPIVNCGAGLGFLPGNLEEKTEKYFEPVVSKLETFLGIKQYRYLKGMGAIQFEPLETMRGSSIANTFVVLDEVSNCTYKQIKMFLSRFDEGSKFVLQGDPTQCDLDYCEFTDALNRLERCDIANFGISTLDHSDIQRPKIVSDLMNVMD